MSRLCPHCLRDVEAGPGSLDSALIGEVIETVADRLVVTPSSIMSGSRIARVVDARNAAIATLSAMFGLSSPELGRIFDRDHSTILHSLKRADMRLVAAVIDDLANTLPVPTGTVTPDEGRETLSGEHGTAGGAVA